MERISQAYILGVKDARSLLNGFPDLCPQTEYEGAKRLLKNAGSEMKEYHKGERDFWKNQILNKKGKTE